MMSLGFCLSVEADLSTDQRQFILLDITDANKRAGAGRRVSRSQTIGRMECADGQHFNPHHTEQ